ncbi:amidohydrolase [Gordonia crocea]|uniref:Amidohydrolase n=1 Tax=Gordonia crocea TaxID=589162 RepID=A0A7I9UYS8_9ACTN|nr:amidohydrolase family protein [Gordonia crocea]GED97981.1 amidohydrolase [Gordonia crocea]
MATQLLCGGTIHTPANPDATAMAVADGMVVWVGYDDVGRRLHPDAEVIDLDGRFVGPGFVDSHVHLTATGLATTGLDLSQARSRSDFLARLRTHAQQLPADEVVWAHGWDESAWSGADAQDALPPTTAQIDDAVGPRPAYLIRVDEHSALVSTALRARVDGLSGLAGHSADGAVTAEAHHAVRAAARQALTPSVRTEARRRALDAMAELGVVSVHENGGPEIGGLDDFREVLATDTGIEVVGLWGEAVADVEHARNLLATTGAWGLAGDVFVDGSLGSHTAWLDQPYTDAPDTRGTAYLDADRVYAHLRALTELRRQGGFHVIGDAAMATVTGALARLADEVGTPAVAACAHRVEHAEMVTDAQREVLARCGVIAVMQPAFDARWGGPGQLYEQRLGTPRYSTLNDFAALAKAGVALAFSSDSPVTPVSPWATVGAAVGHHRSASAVSARAAYGACTRGGWRAAGRNDGLTGVLVPGAPASYAVFDVDRLVVAGSDDKVQRWSTDPRSRVPALPDVSPGAAAPTCVRTVHRDTILYDSGALGSAAGTA